MKKILWFFILQISILIYTTAGIASKLAALEPGFTIKLMLFYGLEIVILGIYAVMWQQVIARLDLSIAYANKGVSLIWSLIWAKALFNEEIKLQNLIGVIIVIIGICLVNTAPERKVPENQSSDNTIPAPATLDELLSEIKEADHE